MLHALVRIFEAHEIWSGAKALDMHFLERRKERGDQIHAYMIVKGLAEVRSHCGALFQVKGNKTPVGNRQTIARELATNGLRSKSLTI